jgi:4-amino-4-deoxy-L-arabinose transferase-like glycosyltransferase
MHEFNTVQWLMSGWWFVEDPTGLCAAGWSRLSCWYYPNHPPLISLIGAPGQWLVGWDVWPIRVVQVAIVLWGVCEVSSLSSRLWGRGAGRAALALSLFNPMLLYYGQIPNYEPTVAALMMITANRCDLLLRSWDRRHITIVALIAAIGFLTDWSYYFLWGGALLLSFSIKGVDRRFQWFTAAMLLLGIMAFALHLALLAHFHGTVQGLFDTAGQRSSIAEGLFSFEFWGLLLLRLAFIITPIPLILCWRGWKSNSTSSDDAEDWEPKQLSSWFDATELPVRWIRFGVPLLLFPAIIHILIFSQGAQVHEYWIYPLLPGLVLGSAAALRHTSLKHLNVLIALMLLIAAPFLVLREEQRLDVQESIELGELVSVNLGEGSQILVEQTLTRTGEGEPILCPLDHCIKWGKGENRPEIYWAMRTSRVSVISDGLTLETLGFNDAALVCAGTEPEGSVTLDSRPTPRCDTGRAILIMHPDRAVSM